MLTLDDICLQITDGSHFSPEDKGTGYPMLSVKDMRDDHFDLSECKYVDEKDYEKLLANGCKPLLNDVVLAKDGSYLKTAFTIKEEQDIALLSSIAILRPDLNKVVPDYLSYFLKSKPVYRTVSLNYISGTALKRIILKGIKKIPVEFPVLEEQQYRVYLLNHIQNIIKMRKQELSKLDNLIKARFVELFGDPVADSMNWGKLPLSHYLKSIRYGTSTPPSFSETGYEFIRATNIKNGKIINRDMKYISEKEAQKIEKCKVFGGEMLIVRSGVNAGDTCIITDIHCGQYAGYDMILVFTEDLHPVFVNVLLNTEYMDSVIKPLTRRAAQPHLNSEQVQSLPIIQVPYIQQEKFADFVHQVDKSKAATFPRQPVMIR